MPIDGKIERWISLTGRTTDGSVRVETNMEVGQSAVVVLVKNDY